MVRKGVIFLIIFLFLIFLLIKLIPKIGENKNVFESIEKDKKVIKKKEQRESLKPAKINLEALEKRIREETLSIGRNIFRYGAPKTNLAEKTPEMTSSPAKVDLKQPPPAPSPPVSPLTFGESSSPEGPGRLPKVEPPNFSYKYLGYFGPEEKKLAVFSDGKEIIDVFEGETISDKFILKKIGYESVTIGFVGFPEDITKKIEVGP